MSQSCEGFGGRAVCYQASWCHNFLPWTCCPVPLPLALLPGHQTFKHKSQVKSLSFYFMNSTKSHWYNIRLLLVEEITEQSMLSDSIEHYFTYFTYGMNLDISLSQIHFLCLCKQNLEDILLNLYLFQVLMSVSALKIHDKSRPC